MTERSHILPEHDVRPYSVAQLAERWGCSGNVVRKLINQGELRCFRIGTLIRIPAAEVARFETAAGAAEPPRPISPQPAEAIARPARTIGRKPRTRQPLKIDKSRVVIPRR